jgi:DNA-binding LacI/PurR family transcriptional regulator
MSTNKLPTIKELARRLNISPASVSRALNGHSCIGLRTKMRVQELARELNYVPNPNAILFKQRKTSTIGVLLPNLKEGFFSEAISGIEDMASGNKYHVIIGQSHDDVEREKQVIASMRNQRVDGIIVSLTKYTRNYDHFMELKNYNIPVVFFDRVPDRKDVNKVSFNMQTGTKDALELLFAKGHRRIALLNGPDEMISSRERTEAYKEFLISRRLKIDLSLVHATDMTQEGTFLGMQELMSRRPAPTAVIAMNDYVALDIMQYARAARLRINKDLSIISYANLPITHYLETPPMASLEQYPYELGSRAAEIMMKLLKDPDSEMMQGSSYNIVIDGKLIVHAKGSMGKMTNASGKLKIA